MLPHARSAVAAQAAALLLSASGCAADGAEREPGSARAAHSWAEARAPEPPSPSPVPHEPERAGPVAPPSAPTAPAPVCAAPCPDCRLLYDEQQARPSQGRHLSPAELEPVRSAYRSYLRSPACAHGGLPPDRIGTDEDIGQVFDVLDGTFSERGRRESLVLFFAGSCGRPSDAERQRGARLFVIMSQGALVGSFLNDQGLASFDRLLDVDGDGVHEVVVVGGWAGKGGLSSWISLRSFAGARDRPLGFFNTLSSGCGWSAEEYWTSSVRYGFREDGRALCFVEQKATLRCPSLLVGQSAAAP